MKELSEESKKKKNVGEKREKKSIFANTNNNKKENSNSNEESSEEDQKKNTIEWRHLIFSKKINDTSFKRHVILVYRGLVYSKKCLKGPSQRFLQSKQVNLCQSKGYFNIY